MTRTLPDRLRVAIGGRSRQQVADAADLAIRTVTRILAGKETRRSTLVHLARALKVREEWLIDNEGPMTLQAAELVAEAAAPTAKTPVKTSRIADQIDHARLGAAIRMARRVIRQPDTAAEWAALGEAVAALYDELTPAPSAAADLPHGLFGALDMDRAAASLQQASTLFAANTKNPSPRELMQATALIYDETAKKNGVEESRKQEESESSHHLP